ncbi:DUF2975 domain-containing protein [Streptosporangium sp. NPDC023615]|uniref:DUF2975 domain-containing protein n=1 Tax=Streptosporangium sp. NPDC023615 TaxID=3154794 RepID=UPI00341AEE4B
MSTSLRVRTARAWWAIFENLIYLAFAIAVIASIGALGMAAGIFHGPASMQIPQLVEWPFTAPRQVGPLRIGLDHSAHVLLDRAERSQVLLLHMPSVVVTLLTAVITFLLWRVARTLRAGDPFVPRNARRIFTMAGCVAGYGLIAEPLRTWVAVITVDGTPAEGMIDTDWPFAPAPLGFALLLAALGAIFRKGTRLREDVRGLV